MFGFLMSFWSAPGQTFFISLFSGEIRAALQLSDGGFATIYSAATLASALIIIWSGPLIDRFDLRRISIVVIAGLALGCLFLSQSHAMWWLFLSLFLLRQFGQSLMTVISSTSVVRYINTDRGKSAAIASMGYAVAEACMPFVIVAVMLLYGWRSTWQLIAVVVLVVMTLCTLLLLRNHTNRHQAYLNSVDGGSGHASDGYVQRQWRRTEVLRDAYFYLFLPGLMSQPLMFTGFIFHQVHLVEFKGWSLETWAALFSVYAVISVLTKIVTGYLVDRFGAIRLVPLISLPMGAGLIVLASSGSLVAGALFLALTGLTVGFYSTLITPFWAEMYGTRYLASIKMG